MNRSKLLWVMSWGLCVAALINLFQGTRYFFSMRRLQQTQNQLASFEVLQNSLRSLAEETVMFSRTNSAIDGILQRFDLKPDGPRPGTAPVNPPPTAPTPARPKAR